MPEMMTGDPTGSICRAWNEMDPGLRSFSVRNAPGRQDDYRWFLEWLKSLEADDVIVTIDRERSTGTLEEVITLFGDAPAGDGSLGRSERVDGILAGPFTEVREVSAVTARHPNGRPARYRPVARIVVAVDVNRKDRPWSDENVLAWTSVRFDPVATERSVDERGRDGPTYVIGLDGRPVMLFDEDSRAYVPVER
ncbi:MAG: hypothetical protein GXY82_04045 [Methanospirillum sp.]|nr:hypothetical protein [Methanospirillum sp.]